MGCGKRRLAKCVNSILTCIRLNFNLFEGGGGVEGRLERGAGGAMRKPRTAVNRHYLWHPRTQLFQGFRGLLATVYIVGHENTVYAWTAVAKVQSPVLGCSDKRPYAHNGKLAYASLNGRTKPTDSSVCCSVCASFSVCAWVSLFLCLSTGVVAKHPNISLSEVEPQRLQEATR